MADSATITTNIEEGGTITSNVVEATTIVSDVTTGGKGDQGEQGVQGEQGIQGIQGEPGDTGNVDGYFNVTQYGAVGDGTTDDTFSIQQAITAANLAGGGVVFFPTGNYLISSPLVVAQHISLLGQGDGAVDGSGGGMGTAASTITQSSTSVDGITGVDVYDFNINQLTITGPGSGTGVGINLALNFHDDSRYIHFTDVTVQNFGHDGIAVDTLIISQFERVVCYGNGRYGFNLYATGTSASTSLTATSCWAHNNTSDGWSIDKMVYSNFISCGADVNGGAGYHLNNCQSVILSSCGAESNTGNAFKVSGASYNISSISCWTFQNSTIAFYVTGNSLSTTIVGFHENTPTGSPTASIQVDAGSTGTTLIGGFFVTAKSIASGTTMTLNDNAGNMTIPGNLEVGGAIQGDSSVTGTDFQLTNTSGGIATNAHYNSGWKYTANGAASLIASDGTGGYIIYTAPSGTTGNAITFTQRAAINSTNSTFSALVSATLQITGGTPGAGKVLTSDASGVATWQTPSGGGGISAGMLTAIIVAASNAPTDWTSAATYTCDGTADDVQIQSAITAAKSDGRPIYLSPGTFNIATTIAIAGDDVTDSDNAISITGAGAYQTNLVAGTNVTIMKLSDSCKVNIHNLLFNVNGSGAGIQSRAVTTSDPYRSFWNSSFKNLLFRGNSNQTNHTGWAMDLGSPFRSTFENIEAYNVKNGIKLFSENAAFNPGDCTFIRCFMELGTNSGGIGYYLNGDPAVMNHCMFINCEAFAYGTTATGIKMDGTTGSMWNNFIGTNLEQFTTVVDIVSGEGNNISCNYIAGRDGVTSTIFKTEAAAYNNRLQAGFAYLNVSGTIWSDANTNTPTQPNYVHDTKLYCDTGATATLTTVASSGFYGNTFDGAGTMPTAWKNTVLSDGVNYGVGTTTGTQIATATTQKLGFFGVTPVVQQGSGADLGTLLASLGLRASGSTYTLATSGNVGFTGAHRLAATTVTTATTLTTSSPPIIYCNSASAFNLTMITTTTTGYYYFIKNISTGVVTLKGTFEGVTDYTLAAGASVMVSSTTSSGAWRVLTSEQPKEIAFQIQDVSGPVTATSYTDQFVPVVFDKTKFSGYKGIYFRGSLSQSNSGTFAINAQLYNATASAVITSSAIGASLAQFGRSIQEIEISASLPASAAAIWMQLKTASGGGANIESGSIVVRY